MFEDTNIVQLLIYLGILFFGVALPALQWVLKKLASVNRNLQDMQPTGRTIQEEMGFHDELAEAEDREFGDELDPTEWREVPLQPEVRAPLQPRPRRPRPRISTPTYTDVAEEPVGVAAGVASIIAAANSVVSGATGAGAYQIGARAAPGLRQDLKLRGGGALRRAIVWSEILGPPVSLRPHGHSKRDP